MTPKWSQNASKNGATTLIGRPAVPLSSSEIREKLAYIPDSPEEREAGIHPEQRRGERKSWHTTRASPRREMQQPPQLSHAPACRGGMGEANLNSAQRREALGEIVDDIVEVTLRTSPGALLERMHT